MSNQIQDKREALLNAALILFAELGFYGTTTSLISKKAGVAAGTLFFHFKTKEDLIDTLYCRIKSELAQAMSQSIDKRKNTTDNLHVTSRNAIIWGIANPEKLKFMELFAHSPFVSTSAYEEGVSQFSFFEELIKDGIEKGDICDVTPPIILGILASTLLGLANYALLTDDVAERERIVEDGLHLIWHGIKR
jgi:AcrR family transcriptional regulator